MTTKYLTKEHIMTIHRELIERFGGLYGIRDESLLESAVGRYQSGYYADPIEEAAALMESLGGNHPFIDGNKRIAVTAPFTFLMVNGYEVLLDEKYAFDFISGLFEAHEFSFAKLEPWIRKNTKPVENTTITLNNKEAVVDYSQSSLNALAELLSAIDNLPFLLEKWGEKIEAMQAKLLGNNLEQNIESDIELLAKEINNYSQQVIETGDHYYKSFITGTEWHEAEIRESEEKYRINRIVSIYETIRESGANIQIAINVMLNRMLETNFRLGEGAYSLKYAVDQLLYSFKGIDDQLEIVFHRCDQLIGLASSRLNEIAKTNKH